MPMTQNQRNGLIWAATWAAIIGGCVVTYWAFTHTEKVMDMMDSSMVSAAHAENGNHGGGFGGTHNGTPARCDCGTANAPGTGLNTGNYPFAGRYNNDVSLTDRNSVMTGQQATADANGNPGNIAGAGGVGGNGPMGDQGGQGANAGF